MKEKKVHRCTHVNSGDKGCDAGSGHSPLREPEPAINEQCVEYDVEAVTDKADAHRNLGLGHTLEVLLASHKKHEGYIAERNDEEVVAVGIDYEWILPSLLGAPGHGIGCKGHEHRGTKVYYYGIFEKLLALGSAALTVGLGHQGSKPVGHANAKNKGNRKNAVRQRNGRERNGSEPTNHDGIGHRSGDMAHLTGDHRKRQRRVLAPLEAFPELHFLVFELLVALYFALVKGLSLSE